MSQQQFNYGPAYPQRPKFFFIKAMRAISKYAAAQDVGLLGALILYEVAALEDTIGYQRAPQFFMRTFMDRFGYGKDAVSEAIHKCVDHGWLVWHQPNSRRQAAAWITFPEWLDESTLVRASDDWAEKTTYVPTNHPTKEATNDPTKHPASSSLLPEPNTPSPTPAEKTEWSAVEALMFELGIQETSEPLRSLKANNVDSGLALGVLRYASESGLWKPAKIRRRLLNLRPGQDPLARNLWMQPDCGPVRQGSASGDSRLEEERIKATNRQLLIDWEAEFGPTLDALTDDEAKSICPESYRSHLRAIKDWRVSPLMRPVLLKVLAERAA